MEEPSSLQAAGGEGQGENIDLIKVEVTNIDKALHKTQETIKGLLKTVDDKFQFIYDNENLQGSLQEQVGQFRSRLVVECQVRDGLIEHISATRKMSDDISKFAKLNDGILQSMDEMIQEVGGELSQQKRIATNNLNDLRSYIEKLDLQIAETNNDLIQQRKTNDEILAKEDEKIESLKKLYVGNELEVAISKEIMQQWIAKQQDIANDIKNKQHELSLVKRDISSKEAEQEELRKLHERKQEEFDLTTERLETSLSEINKSILNIEGKLHACDQSSEYQTECITRLLKEIEIKKNYNSKLVEDTAEISQSADDDISNWNKAKFEAEAKINTESAEIEKLEVLLQQEDQIIKDIDERILNKTKEHDELDQAIKEMQLKMAQRESARETLMEFIKNKEDQIRTLSKQCEDLSDEYQEFESSSTTMKREAEEELTNLNIELNRIKADTEKITLAEQEQQKATLQEISALELEYDKKTFQQTKDFEESVKLLKSELVSVENELKEIRLEKAKKQNELLMLDQACQHVQIRIKRTEKMKQLVSTIPSLGKTQSTPPPMKRPSDLPVHMQKRLAVDQLSDSSTDAGSKITAAEARKIIERREQRRLLRQKRREEKENKTRKEEKSK
uniref:Uncharacterized protein n=1 Tax=Photinus pyralis TaxID=7054 RepID=A0A1Y1JTN1_PHOPY